MPRKSKKKRKKLLLKALRGAEKDIDINDDFPEPETASDDLLIVDEGEKSLIVVADDETEAEEKSPELSTGELQIPPPKSI